MYEEADVERIDAVVRLVAEGLKLPAAITRVASVGTSALPAGEAETLLYRQILQGAGHGIWVIRDGHTRYANRRMAEMMGCSVDELIALPVLDIFEPATLPRVRERTKQVREGEPLHFSVPLRRVDGSTFLAEVDTTPLLDQAGRYEGAISLVNDITARHETDTQTRVRAKLLDSIGEAAGASTPDGKIFYVNAAAERLFGWRAADVIGRNGLDLFPAQATTEEIARVLGVLSEGKTHTGKLKLHRPGGGDFVARLTAAPVVDDEGELVGFVAVVSDQTERDQLRRDRRVRARQAETLALLGVQALRARADPRASATLILTEAVDATRRLLEADQAMVLDVIAGANELNVCAASPPLDEPFVVPAGSRSFAGYTVLAGKVVVVEDAPNDGRFELDASSGGHAMAAAIGAPVFGPAGIVGVLVAKSSMPRHFDNSDAHFLQGMANIIGTALLS
jgi:PAS domain S-box-containing protein